MNLIRSLFGRPRGASVSPAVSAPTPGAPSAARSAGLACVVQARGFDGFAQEPKRVRQADAVDALRGSLAIVSEACRLRDEAIDLLNLIALEIELPPHLHQQAAQLVNQRNWHEAARGAPTVTGIRGRG